MVLPLGCAEEGDVGEGAPPPVVPPDAWLQQDDIAIEDPADVTVPEDGGTDPAPGDAGIDPPIDPPPGWPVYLTLSEVEPATGDVLGDDQVQLTGTGFVSEMIVLFDGLVAPDVFILTPEMAVVRDGEHRGAGLGQALECGQQPAHVGGV